jgi:hypothetical protein
LALRNSSDASLCNRSSYIASHPGKFLNTDWVDTKELKEFLKDQSPQTSKSGVSNGLECFTTRSPRESVVFSIEDTLKEAELSLGPQETFQEANMSFESLSHLPLPPKLTNEKPDALPLAEASNPGTSTRQEPVHDIEMRAQKRTKMDEVDEGRILPEGSRRKRNQTA